MVDVLLLAVGLWALAAGVLLGFASVVRRDG